MKPDCQHNNTCGTNVKATPVTSAPQATVRSPASCFLHYTPAVGSCGKCLRPVCNLCLVKKGDFLTGESQVCLLCVRYENALNWSAGIAIVLFIVLSLATFNLLIGLIVALPVFVLLRRQMRRKSERELGVGM